MSRNFIFNTAVTLIGCCSIFTVNAQENGQKPYSGTLPVIFINTENNAPITSKENYIKGTYYLDPMGTQAEAIGSESTPLPLQIRGRGNYTWTGFDKKPYRLKLDSKAPLLGMHKSKHFALLAHADDQRGFMRNIVGFELSRRLGMPYTPADEPVEVVLNGDYIGLYFLTETIRVDKDRVNITEQDDNLTPTSDNPFAVTGGWLVEKDNYDSDPHVTIKEDGTDMWFTYKTPEILSSAQEEYLFSNLENVTNAIYSDDKNTADWGRLVDMDLFARFYIIQEIMDNTEAFHGSCYITKDIDTDPDNPEKWKFGPVWDFGSSFFREKNCFCYENTPYTALWIKEAIKYPEFLNKVKEIWKSFYNGDFQTMESFVDDQASRIADAAKCDAQRWTGQYDSNSDMKAKAEEVKSYLRKNSQWINNRMWEDNQAYEWTVYFKDNVTPAWEEVYAFVWTDEGMITGKWPGTKMETTIINGNEYFIIKFKTDKDIEENAQIIFGNGLTGVDEGNQTKDLKFRNNAFYDRKGFIEGAGITTPDISESELKIYSQSGILIIESDKTAQIRVIRADGTYSILSVTKGINRYTEIPKGFYIIGQQKIII